MLARDALINNPQRLLETGKPVASNGCTAGLGQGRRKRAGNSTSSVSYATKTLVRLWRECWHVIWLLIGKAKPRSPEPCLSPTRNLNSPRNGVQRKLN